MTNTPARSRATLTGISSRAWEHPADRGALVALRKLKGFDTILKTMSGLVNERSVRLVYLGSSIRVDERQFSRLHYALHDVARVLDVEEVPEMYVQASPVLNAMTIGMDKPIIVVNSALVDLLDDEEMRFVIAHELGHAISGHAVYRTLLMRLLKLTGVFSAVPLGGLGLRGIVAALYEWSRKAELSADRAGLLATQDPATAFQVHMQLASGGHLEDLDTTSFFAQGQEYLQAADLRDSVLKLMLIENATHPFAVVRAGGSTAGSTPRSSPAVIRGATRTPRPRSATRPRRPRPATSRPSSPPRTCSARWSTTWPAGWAASNSGSTRSSAARTEPPFNPQMRTKECNCHADAAHWAA